ncbi:MAG: GNAT family N-acetyltransferase [Pseudomonadota bacterium]
MILNTARLSLRPQQLGDAALLFSILGDPQAMRFWSRPAITRLAVVEEQVREQQEAMASGLCRYWTVEEDGDAIGSVDLSLIQGASAELGFLLRRDRWNRGLGTEAAGSVIAYAFGPMALRRLAAGVMSGNLAAARLLEKSGFARIDSRPVRLAGGVLADCAFYALDRG